MPVEEMSLPCSWLPPAVFTTLEVEMSYRSLNCQPYVNTQSRTRTSGNGVGMAGTGTSNSTRGSKNEEKRMVWMVERERCEGFSGFSNCCDQL